jgi:myosin heavy subunit
MNYLHYLADVLILQSAVRKWIASRYVIDLRRQREFVSARLIQAHVRGFMVRQENKQTKAALVIQKSWRGFVSYAEYMFTIADIVTAQTQARCWVARRRRKDRLDMRDAKAATTIQTQWRGATARANKKAVLQHVIICQSLSRRLLAKIRFRRNLLQNDCAMIIQRFWYSYRVRREEIEAATSIQKVSRGFLQRNKYAVAIQEHRASIKIQAAWRRFWLFSNFIITLDSVIVAQSIVRRYLTRVDLENKASKATLIQAKQRSINARRTASAKSMVKALCSASDAIAGKEVDSAVIIQTHIRGYSGRSNLFLHRMARIIQTNWRGVIPRRALEENRAALRVQTWWRRLVRFTAYKQYMSSREDSDRLEDVCYPFGIQAIPGCQEDSNHLEMLYCT